MKKTVLRSLYLQRRVALSADEVRHSSAAIIKKFMDVSWAPVHALFSYVPIQTRNEFDVRPCEQYLQQRDPLMICALPRTHHSTLQMDAYRIFPQTIFEENAYGIPEPAEAEAIDPLSLSMVFVPLVAFDLKGYRVGYGKGYYDRFFARCKKDVLRVGFSFFDPVAAIEDISHFDVPLSHCITPSRIYEF